MIEYMPKEPCKYCLLIRTLCDAKNAHFGSVGVGLIRQDKKLLVLSQCVLQLTKPIGGSNRNVTTENWFSSVELIDKLRKRKLTLGAERKNEL